MKQYKDKLYISNFSRPTPGRCLWGLPAQVKVFDNAMKLLAGDLPNSSIAFIHSGLCQQFIISSDWTSHSKYIVR